MENEELIRKEMAETRTSLTEKLETLEGEVVDTVKGATSAVNETVENIKESVQDTIATVKDTVKDTVGTVKESVQDSVETVKEWLDIKAHCEAHPWWMMGGSAVLGYWLGTLFSATPEPAVQEGNGRPSHSGNGHHRDKRHGNSQQAAKKALDLGPELTQLKGLALGALLGTAREISLPAVPESMKPQVKEIVDNLTKKLGGEPVSGPQARRDQSSAELSDSETLHRKRFA